MSASKSFEDRSRAELRCLVASAVGNLVIAMVGLTVSFLSRSQAILLDGLFNLIYFATALFTLKVARLVLKGDDERFPYGYAFFEPLVNGLKGVLVLGVSLMALFGAAQALIAGGREISPGLALAYGIFATIAGWVLALLTFRGARRSESPLVRADADNWVVNAAVSACVLLAFGAIFVIRDTKLAWLVPYVDPLIVLLVVLVSLAVPLKMVWRALMELLNRRPAGEVVDRVTEIVRTGTAELPVEALYVRVIRPGRTLMVGAHVVLPAEFGVERLSALDKVRRDTLARLAEAHPGTILDLFFTTDAEWGKPTTVTPAI